MSIVYMRAPHTAFVMGFESDASPDDASYIANLKTSEIVVLKGPSAVIWEILEQPTGSESLISEIKDIYGVSRETVAPSVLAFLQELREQGLIQLDTNTID